MYDTNFGSVLESIEGLEERMTVLRIDISRGISYPEAKIKIEEVKTRLEVISTLIELEIMYNSIYRNIMNVNEIISRGEK